MSELDKNEIDEEMRQPEGQSNAVVPSDNSITNYLDFLDKEMTLTGILSAFSVAVVSLFLNAVGSADLDKKTLFAYLLSEQPWYILLGSGLILGAAGFFYGQRSSFAWRYGEIAGKRDVPNEQNKIPGLMKTLNYERAWRLYHLAFRLLWFGFLAYAFAFLTLAIEKAYGHLYWLDYLSWIFYLVVSISLFLVTRRRLYGDELRKPLSERVTRHTQAH